MTGSGPWSTDSSNERRRASAVLDLALRRGLMTREALRRAVEAVGEDPGEVDAARSVEIAIEIGLLHPDAVNRLEREAATQVSGKKPNFDPFDRFPVEHWDRYELIDFIGRGGMGDVFRAKDPRLGRTVAIKFLRRDDPDVVQRFVREARIQSKVDHEGVCPVYEVGEVEGHPFIVMQYVAGGALPEVRERLGLRDKALIMADVADALHAAHRLDLVHRDIKPANIMVELTPGGTWRPFVVDFGIAREIETSDVTRTGAILGTPAFAAPEQIRGRTDEVDARSDIYSLGATLYWFLTGRAPFEGSIAEILEGHTGAEPKPPSQLEKTIPKDLETIIMKCLEVDRDRRYLTAYEVAEDLRRFLAGEPITARRGSVFYRVVKVARRHPVAATAVLTALATLAALGGLTLRTRWKTARQTAIAHALIERVNAVEEIARMTAMMPRHDTSPERARVETMVEELRADAEGLGDLARGPTQYALGRIHLVLGEVDDAVSDLERAWDSGFQNPAVAAALGRALGQAYEQALRRTRLIADPQLRASSETDATNRFRDRALELLHMTGSNEVENPALTEAQVAYYEGRYDAALEAAATAHDRSPWDWHLVRLQGDIHAAAASRAAGDGNVDQALDHLGAAGRAYEQALDIARSDARSMTALCHRWLLEMDVRERHGDPGQTAFRHAQAACESARRTAPGERGPWEATALLHWRRAQHLADRGRDPEEALVTARQAAIQAIELVPESAEGHHALGGTFMVAALDGSRRGRDPEPLMAKAIEELERAWKLEPANPVIADDLGFAYDRRARHRLDRGIDPREDLRKALETYERALVLSPGYANAHNNSGIAYIRKALWEFRSGIDPEPSLTAAETAFEQALDINPQYAYAWVNLGIGLRIRAQNELRLGRPADAALNRARVAIDRGLSINPTLAYAFKELAIVELTAARSMLARGDSPERSLDLAAAAVRSAVDLNPNDAEAWRASAEIHRLRAESGTGPSTAAVRQGRRDVRRALELNPNAWQAMISNAALLLLENPPDFDRAESALAAAVATNPLARTDAEPIHRRINAARPKSPSRETRDR